MHALCHPITGADRYCILPTMHPAIPFTTSSTEITAPWEARTPDLEVNSLTLWPAELRKLVHHAEKSWFLGKKEQARARMS